MYKFDFSAFEKNGITRVGELNPYITLACDLRCQYCYMFNFLAKAKDTSELMSPDFLIDMVEFFSRQSGGLDRMTLLGGEPTLHPDITEICNAVSGMSIKELRMTTNGIGMHHLDLSKLKANVFDHVSISIDGIESSINNATRGKATFDKIIDTIKAYLSAGIPVSINYTVTNKNISSLQEVLPFFSNLGVSIVNFHRASMDGNAYKNPDLIVSAKDWIQARDDLFKFIGEHQNQFPNLKIRIPYTFVTKDQLQILGYKPIQEQNYHSPEGGHRLIVFPPTDKGQGLCYMSSDVIGQENAELGMVTSSGQFIWNDNPLNEMTAYKRLGSTNVSSEIKGQDGELAGSQIIRVSHSFKATIYTGDKQSEIYLPSQERSFSDPALKL